MAAMERDPRATIDTINNIQPDKDEEDEPKPILSPRFVIRFDDLCADDDDDDDVAAEVVKGQWYERISERAAKNLVSSL